MVVKSHTCNTDCSSKAARYAKDMDFEARYVLIKTSTSEALEQRLKALGKDDTAIQEILKRLATELEPEKTEVLFNTTIVVDDEQLAVKSLRDYIYRKSESETAGAQGLGEDISMKEGDEANAEDAETKEATMTDA